METIINSTTYKVEVHAFAQNNGILMKSYVLDSVLLKFVCLLGRIREKNQRNRRAEKVK